MIIHSISLYFVSPSNAPSFVACLGEGGLGCALSKKLQPELIGIDLLHSRESPSMFLCTEFWCSGDAYLRRVGSPARLALASLLRSLSTGQIEFGAFSFPERADGGESVPAPPAVAPSTKPCGSRLWSTRT
jgi:hypothetical protein